MPKLLGLQDVAENLLGGELNNIGAVLTLARWLRPIFDTSEFFLEEHDGEPDTYGVRATMNERSFHNATKPRRRVQLEGRSSGQRLLHGEQISPYRPSLIATSLRSAQHVRASPICLELEIELLADVEYSAFVEFVTASCADQFVLDMGHIVRVSLGGPVHAPTESKYRSDLHRNLLPTNLLLTDSVVGARKTRHATIRRVHERTSREL
ncbi:hypothetical protein GLOTRDRAFT_140593 [Gloeophyllum trabeum ATCC 11539]|uniref:Uncharacterized protein n=1 Tax=Gloeophyllum trabeum (strain ATCC 11539 / FP-39264 / Madison 617) TaxID=670483 RepID=S7RD91_GLOTA|nr:uncharacterized protein GLOTRDRAFT_140593 [Gloeophyllum trabeum ATCC 11539]EPQ52180.1 hypothetical protein GLOTRDRAFT_140593 [Gloeophyllum trabeum ATCC 11539]